MNNLTSCLFYIFEVPAWKLYREVRKTSCIIITLISDYTHKHTRNLACTWGWSYSDKAIPQTQTTRNLSRSCRLQGRREKVVRGRGRGKGRILRKKYSFWLKPPLRSVGLYLGRLQGILRFGRHGDAGSFCGCDRTDGPWIRKREVGYRNAPASKDLS